MAFAGIGPEYTYGPLAAIAAGQGGLPEKLSAAGAISLKTSATQIDISAGANVAFTLADGAENQRKVIYLNTKGGAGNAVVTPANFQGASVTLTLDTAGDVVELIFIGGEWRVLSNSGATVA